MQFCPVCSNCLLLQKEESSYQFTCPTCSYFYPIVNEIHNVIFMKTKALDDIISADDWSNAEQIKETCPKCGNPKAYFKQQQARSADEASTIFFKCTNSDCKHQWIQN